MGELTYPCARCGGSFFESMMKYRGDGEGHDIPYCPKCYRRYENMSRIRDLHSFAKELLTKWEVDAPKSSEYLKGYINAMEIVLALLKG
jgi:DNA-directed RNA polymerase subunit RPC12/RpoP